MSFKIERPNEIGINERFKITLNGVEIQSRQKVELEIGGHWIAGIVHESKKTGQWFWCAYPGYFVTELPLFASARWP